MKNRTMVIAACVSLSVLASVVHAKPKPGQTAHHNDNSSTAGAGSVCGKYWNPSYHHWDYRCMTNPPTDGTFIASQDGHKPSPDELRHTPPPAGASSQPTKSIQPAQGQAAQAHQPPPSQNNGQEVTNLINSIKGLFHK